MGPASAAAVLLALHELADVSIGAAAAFGATGAAAVKVGNRLKATNRPTEPLASSDAAFADEGAGLIVVVAVAAAPGSAGVAVVDVDCRTMFGWTVVECETGRTVMDGTRGVDLDTSMPK